MKRYIAWAAGCAAALLFAWPAAAAEPPSLDDLPIVAVPPAGATHGRIAVMLSGDGGWADLVQEVSAALARDGIGVAGLNSLKYFWTQRTPQETAHDVERIVEHYMREWHADQLVLIGYSFGADVLPDVLNHLPADLRAQVRGLTLIAPSSVANYEVHVTSWLGVAHPGEPTLPALERLRGLPMVCIYGEEDTDAVCPKLPAGLARVEKMAGGHHFGGDFAAVARQVLP
ncbi:MAG TPA: AcvB/VirJ family lysyl-phosphatidylglycerol hydrolase [Steroidobacteraceae bacterium]